MPADLVSDLHLRMNDGNVFDDGSVFVSHFESGLCSLTLILLVS